MDPVQRVELYHFAAPLPAAFRPSWIPGFPQTENRCTLVRVITTDGLEGWSAGPSIGRERAGVPEEIRPPRTSKYVLIKVADDDAFGHVAEALRLHCIGRG